MKTFLISLIMFLYSVSWAAAAPQVVVSIKPLHSLVAGVMLGVGEPQLLVKAGGSPHGYSLRPSEARALAHADLVIWVGHQLEGFLEKPLSTLGREAQTLELMEALRAELLPLREGGRWDDHDDHADEHAKHAEEDEQHAEEQAGYADKHGDHEEEFNPHLWLDPALAKKIVAQVAESLSELDPENRRNYRENADRLMLRLDELQRKLAGRLGPVREVPFLVFHDAYQYFEAAFDLNAVGSIAVDPERRPGARRIIEIREKIKTSGARCVFSEPQFEPRLVATIIEGTGAGTGVLDPLGADLEPGEESYFQLMENLAENLVEGLR